MDIHHLVELAESLHRDSGTEAGLEAIEAYSKGDITCLDDLATVIGQLQKRFPTFRSIVAKWCETEERIRTCDIYRLIHCAADRERMAQYLISIRPDLEQDVLHTMDDLEVAA
jgi:hypothetical protein|tara:strand:- start:3392 stop:3730 length:339 start_codon:yes stop_codon:yes gene_type:complete